MHYGQIGRSIKEVTVFAEGRDGASFCFPFCCFANCVSTLPVMKCIDNSRNSVFSLMNRNPFLYVDTHPNDAACGPLEPYSDKKSPV